MSDVHTATFVKTKSPVENQNSLLYKWDSSVRQNFCAFESNISQLKQGIQSLYSNPLTSFRDEVQFGHRYSELETLKLRQQLGHITSEEKNELNERFG